MAKKKISRISNVSEEAATIIGLSCNENDYRVCWDINNILKLRLSKISNITVRSQKNTINEFSLYSFADEQKQLQYYLMPNKGSMGFLSESYKMIDYFIIIYGSITPAQTEKIISDLKKSQIISAAFLIPTQSIRLPQLPC